MKRCEITHEQWARQYGLKGDPNLRCTEDGSHVHICKWAPVTKVQPKPWEKPQEYFKQVIRR